MSSRPKRTCRPYRSTTPVDLDFLRTLHADAMRGDYREAKIWGDAIDRALPHLLAELEAARAVAAGPPVPQVRLWCAVNARGKIIYVTHARTWLGRTRRPDWAIRRLKPEEVAP